MGKTDPHQNTDVNSIGCEGYALPVSYNKPSGAPPSSTTKTDRHDVYMLSGCELIDTENISLPSQNMKFGGE
jgi:hypothetical protein